MMGDLSKELDFDFKRNSSLVLCFAQEDLPALQALYERGDGKRCAGYFHSDRR